MTGRRWGARGVAAALAVSGLLFAAVLAAASADGRAAGPRAGTATVSDLAAVPTPWRVTQTGVPRWEPADVVGPLPLLILTASLLVLARAVRRAGRPWRPAPSPRTGRGPPRDSAVAPTHHPAGRATPRAPRGG